MYIIAYVYILYIIGIYVYKHIFLSHVKYIKKHIYIYTYYTYMHILYIYIHIIHIYMYIYIYAYIYYIYIHIRHTHIYIYTYYTHIYYTYTHIYIYRYCTYMYICISDIFVFITCMCNTTYDSPNSSWAEWGSQFLLETAFVPSWFAGSSWFRLGFRCLSPFFSLLSFLRKGFLFHHDLLVPLGSGWGSGACLLSSLFFLSSGKGFCSIMICWFLLVPAGVAVLVSLLLSSFFPQARASVPSWFTGSSLFGLGIRCLSPFFSLFFLRKGLLFHHDLLVPPSSGWGSGACLPSLFFLSSGQGSVPSWFAGSSWFRLGFRCLSPFFSLLSFLRKGFLFHHDLLVPLGSGWGSGACLLSSLFFLSSGKGFCSIMIYWFLPLRAGDPVLVSLLLPFFSHERASVPSWFTGSSLFGLGIRCLSPFFSLFFLTKGLLFHHDLLVPPSSGWGSGACLPSFFFSGKGFCSIMDFLVPLGSGWGSGACLLSSLFFLSSGKGFCSIMICWFLLVPAGVPVLVSFLLSSFFPQERVSVPLWFAGSSWFRLGFRCLSPFFSLLSFLRQGLLFHHDLLVPPSSGWGSGACLPSSPFFFSRKGFCSIMIYWFLPLRDEVPVLVSLLFFSQERASVPSWISWFILLPAGVPVLVSLLLALFFSEERDSVPSWISWFLLLRAGVPVLVSLLLSSFFSQQECARQFHEFWIAHDLGGNMRCCCLGSMLV